MKMSQQSANTYVGCEVIVESNAVLTKGTATRLEVRNDIMIVSLKDASWQSGKLSDLPIDRWNAIAPQPMQVLLSTEIESSLYGETTLGPSPQGTRAALSSV